MCKNHISQQLTIKITYFRNFRIRLQERHAHTPCIEHLPVSKAKQGCVMGVGRKP